MNAPQNNPSNPSAPQDIDAAYDRFVQRENNQLMQSMAGSVDQDPDAYARAQQLGMQMGVGADIAKRNMNELMRQQKMDDLQSRNLSALNPILARQLSDPQFASIAHDDVANLLKSDEFWQANSFTGNPVADWMILSSTKASVIGGIATAKSTTDAWDLMQRHRSGDKAAYEEYKKLEAETEKYSSLSRGVIGGTTEVLAQYMFNAPTILRDASVGAVTAGAYGALGGPLAPATMGVGLAAGFTGGLATGMARTAFQMEAASSYFDSLKSGYDPDSAAYVAYGVGTINAALEIGGLEFSSRLTRKAFTGMLQAAIAERAARAGIEKTGEALLRPSLMRGIGQAAIEGGKGVLAEASEEVSQDTVQMLGHELSRKLSPGNLESRFSKPGEMRRFAGELADTFFQTVESTVLLQVPGMAGHIHNTRTMVNKAKKTAQFYDALAKASEGKLKVRAPGAAEAFHAAYANR
ncbi:MAG: hypothetical protein EBY29_09155, partial [Planctomycetes bacterium]|nr:hypothetical protein [Planctomycetota bacterium]